MFHIPLSYLYSIQNPILLGSRLHPWLGGLNALCPTELSDLKGKHAALKNQSAVFAAELDDVKAKLEQTTAAKV